MQTESDNADEILTYLLHLFIYLCLVCSTL